MIMVKLDSLRFLNRFVIPFNTFMFTNLADFFVCSVGGVGGFSSRAVVLTNVNVVFLFRTLRSLVRCVTAPRTLRGVIF